MTSSPAEAQPSRIASRLVRHRTVLAVIVGVVCRLAVLGWSHPWTPHHPDEHILPLEAVALWEGITPREIGWPASTARIALSVGSAVQLLAEQGGALWTERNEPDRALATISRWIGARYVDPTSSYKLGRGFALAVGCLHLLATVWALRQWAGEGAVLAGTAGVALAPLAVAYSQFVLSDMAGLLMATLLIGLAARPARPKALLMAALAGMAAAGKFHFGIWLLTPLLCVWLDRANDRRMRDTLTLLAVFALTLSLLVPWIWTNPGLAIKEFAGVVLVKVVPGGSSGSLFDNLALILRGLGALTLVGAAAGFWKVRSQAMSARVSPVVWPTVVAMIALSASGTVFDRYGLVLMPGMALMAAIGWMSVQTARHPASRLTGRLVLVICVVVTAADLAQTQYRAGQTDVDVSVQQWIRAHVAAGSRVAVHHEANSFLPRHAGQLAQCADQTAGDEALAAKWRIHGVREPVARGQAFRNVILNDEVFDEFWCRREALARGDAHEGFVIVRYHREPRFGAILESDAITRFGLDASQADAIDVLAVSRALELGVRPAAVFQTARGQRLVYVR